LCSDLFFLSTAGSWKLEAVSWQLAAVSWQLANGSWTSLFCRLPSEAERKAES
jgi:hypothetical protein